MSVNVYVIINPRLYVHVLRSIIVLKYIYIAVHFSTNSC